MKCHAINSLRRSSRAHRFGSQHGCKSISTVHRQRVTDLWRPSRTRAPDGPDPRSVTTALIDAGYVRQASAGIFHLLPLGLRVLSKLERLIDKHMQSLGASKLSLASISKQSLWETSGRLANNAEMFKFGDRSGTKLLLAPTHEEEITTLLVNEIWHDNHLPLRLYQIGRKYRDEQRPRGGLLRGREFVMKDLYTFDATPQHAAETYQAVRQAYRNFFSELAVPFIEARADSGNMGGDLSHEFHFPHETGEDTVITCDNCGFSRNEEFVAATQSTVKHVEGADQASEPPTSSPVGVRDYISYDRATLTRIILPINETTGQPYASTDINTFAVKEAMSEMTDVNTGVEEYRAVRMFEERIKNHKQDQELSQLVYLVDSRVTSEQLKARTQQDMTHFQELHSRRFVVQSASDAAMPINLISTRDGDPCPDCLEAVRVRKAIEIGHTFHLGTRYSSALNLTLLPSHKKAERKAVEMGCHGIGVTRLLAASVSCLSDVTKDEINWPRAIAPYDVVICDAIRPGQGTDTMHRLYDELVGHTTADLVQGTEPLDVVLDDRANRNYLQKLQEAKTLGPSVIVMLGGVRQRRGIQVLCPRLAIEEDLPQEAVAARVRSLIAELSKADKDLGAGGAALTPQEDGEP